MFLSWRLELAWGFWNCAFFWVIVFFIDFFTFGVAWHDWLSVFVEVGLFMSCKIRGLSESLVAACEGADVWLLAGVRAQVGSQIEIEGEAFLAYVAFVRLLTRVHQLMTLELRVVEELLATACYWAGEHLLSMGQLMLPQGSNILKDFLTVFKVTNKTGLTVFSSFILRFTVSIRVHLQIYTISVSRLTELHIQVDILLQDLLWVADRLDEWQELL